MIDTNADRLADTIANARAIRTYLSDTLRKANGKAHVRPTAGGVTLLSLLDTSPPIGHGPYHDAAQLATDFQAQFDLHCLRAPVRPTPEKRLQSFLIADAYRHDRRMAALGAGELLFITDELALQANGAKVVCDILAFRPDPANPSEGAPVLIELKSARHLTRLIEQLTVYGNQLCHYKEQFAALYSAVLGRDIRLTSEPERWLVWPAIGGVLAPDPRAAELQVKGIRIVQYKEQTLFQFAASLV